MTSQIEMPESPWESPLKYPAPKAGRVENLSY